MNPCECKGEQRCDTCITVEEIIETIKQSVGENEPATY